MATQHIFSILGGGSIGARHARNLRALGQTDIRIIEPDTERAVSLRAEGLRVEADPQAAFAPEVEAILICTPTVHHLAHARQAAEHDKHLFIEKPIAASWDGVDALVQTIQARGLVSLMGYNMRFRDGYTRAKALLDEGAIGRPLAARALVSFYLPHYHPGTDYRTRYQAQRALGGGVVLDDSHELDYLLDLFGPVAEVAAHTGRLSDLDLDVEDYAGVLLKHRSGVVTQLQMDFLGRVFRRELDITGSEGTLTLDHNSGELRHYGPGPAGYRVWPPSMAVTLNQMYLNEMAHFLDCLAGRAQPVADAAQGREVLRVALALFQASQQGRTIHL